MKAKISSFYMVESWIIEEVGFNTNACIIAYIYSYQKNKNKCTPKLDTLSEIMKLSRTAIIRHLKQLESNGYIETVRHINEGKKTSNQINEYRVNLKKFPQYQCKGEKICCNETIQQSNETIQQSNETIQQSNETIQQSNETIQQSNETIQPQSNETIQPLNIIDNSVIENINTESSIENVNKPTAEPEKQISKSKRFVPPTIDEVRAYCFERNNGIDAQHFMDYYTSNGWKVGKNPMKDWKATVRTWEKNSYSGSSGRSWQQPATRQRPNYDPNDPMNEGMI